MHKHLLSLAAAALLLFGVSSCSTLNALSQNLNTDNTGTALAAGGNILDNLLGSVLGSQPITERELVGRWGYTGVSTVLKAKTSSPKLVAWQQLACLEAKLG